MPATLRKDGEVLRLALSGHPNFREALSRAKQIPGRKFDPETKDWIFPANEPTAMRIMHTVNPSPDATVMGWLREAGEKVADELTSALPATAELLWRAPEGQALFDFQPPVIDFMATMQRVLNADDMGLGKTIDAIGAVQEFRERLSDELTRQHKAHPGDFDVAAHAEVAALRSAPKLVVAGTTKLGDWRDEIEKWAPGEPVLVVPGDKTAKRRRALLTEFDRHYVTEGGWLIVNHEQLRAEPPTDEDGEYDRRGIWRMKQDWFADIEWLAAIADEAHRFKNREAQQTRGLWQIDAKLRYALTGTAIINSPDELWAILHWLRPDQYEEDSRDKVTYWQFFNTYVESYPVPDRGLVVTGVKNGEELRFEMADKWARRTKKLLREKGLLPDKLPTRIRTVAMKPAQRALYEEAESALWLAIEQDVEALDEETRERVVELLERGLDPSDVQVARHLPNAAAKHAALRQIATSPALLGAKDDSGKLDALMEEIEDNPGKPFVVFCWHRLAAETISARLERRRISSTFIHGGVSYDERYERLKAFDAGAAQVLVATIKTGGEGLNLVRADTALFAEQSDSITENDQAEDRLHRIGQTVDVNVIVFRSDETVETDKQAHRLRMKELVQGATVGRDRAGEEAA